MKKVSGYERGIERRRREWWGRPEVAQELKDALKEVVAIYICYLT